MLERTLPTALAQTGLAFEVLVVDNGSPFPDTDELVKKLAKKNPELRLVKLTHQAGYTGAVNAGVVAAKYPLVAVLGNDNKVPSDWLESLLKIWNESNDRGESVGAVMSQTQVGSTVPEGPYTLNHFGRNVCYQDLDWKKRPYAVFYPGGNSFLFDKETLGLPFEDFYFAYHEDVSLGWRCQNMGLAVLQSPSPWVHSFDGGSTKRPEVRHRTLMLTERNRWLNLLTFPSLFFILRLAPIWCVDSLFSLLLGRHRFARLEAWAWLAQNFSTVIRLRQKRQAERRVKDSVALREMSYLYFSTVPRRFSVFAQAKQLVNLVIYLYLRLLMVPGKKHS